MDEAPARVLGTSYLCGAYQPYSSHHRLLGAANLKGPGALRRYPSHLFESFAIARHVGQSPLQGERISPGENPAAGCIDEVLSAANSIADQNRSARRHGFVHREAPGLAVGR